MRAAGVMQNTNLAMEIYFLESGYGSIDLQGDDFDCLISFQGKPYAINWCDCEGSVGQYLVRTGIRGYKKDLRQLRMILSNGLDPKMKISDQIYPLLQLFRYGNLYLSNYTARDWDVLSGELSKQVQYYPLGNTFVPTQPSEGLNKETIDGYIAQISNGGRPLVVTASVEDGWCEFVVDGHHKLEAYGHLKIAPNVLNFRKPKSKLPIDEGLRILEGKPSMQTYKKVKVKYDNG